MPTKLLELGERMARVRTHTSSEASDLEKDQDALDLVSYNLMLSIQACLDLATHFISDGGLGQPGDLGGETALNSANIWCVSARLLKGT